MRFTFHFLLMLAAIALGLGSGFALRSSRAVGVPSPTQAAFAPAASANSPANSIRRSHWPGDVHRQDDSPLATQLQRDLSMSTGVTQWLYWLEALEKAASSDFPRLLRLAQGNPAAAHLVQARWIEIAPRQLFDLLVAGAQGLPVAELGYALFDEWPKRDPDAAIAALNEAGPGRSADHHWRFTAAYALIEKDIERALRLMKDWHVDDVGFGSRGIKATSKWTQANPQHAAEFVLEQSEAYSFRSAMEVVGQEWAKIDPASALAFATGKQSELASTLATQVLKHWAQENLSAAADWLAAADDRTRRRLSPTFIEAWATKDAPGALVWCEENLAGSILPQSVAAVVRGAAEKDVAAAAALVTEMNPSAARAEAATAVARKWMPPGLPSDQRVTPKTVAWLERLDAESVRRVIEGVAWTWATSDPRSMAAFLKSSNNEQIPPFAYTVAARELARRSPPEALDWASRLTGPAALSAGGAAFSEWRDSQPESAMKWLADLPATDPRREPYFETALQSLAHHPQAVEQLAGLSPAERAMARDVIAKINLPEERRAKLLDALKTR